MNDIVASALAKDKESQEEKETDENKE